MKLVTVIIPTQDESLHVKRAVLSASQLGPVFVVDSGSSDDTVDLARSSGATVVYQPWLGHAAQKNWALDHLPIDTEWILFLDADEKISCELTREIQNAVTSNRANSFYLPRRNRFMGRNLDHVWWYPDYQLRLFQHGFARYEEREVHEHMITSGIVGHLQEPLLHESLKDVKAFLERHMRYAEAEAREIAAAASVPQGSFWGQGRSARRRAVKVRIWYRLRHRPAIRYMWLYVIRRGFLDGEQGRVYSGLISAYEAMIDAFLLEHKLSIGSH